jgi:hypothetical protein
MKNYDIDAFRSQLKNELDNNKILSMIDNEILNIEIGYPIVENSSFFDPRSDYSYQLTEDDFKIKDYYDSLWKLKDFYKRNDIKQEQQTKQAFQLRKKQGAKTDLIRILNAVYELKMFEMTDGQIPSKEMFMKQAGEFFGTDLSKYDIDLSQALNNTSLEANLKVFEQMKEVTQNSHYIGKKEK